MTARELTTAAQGQRDPIGLLRDQVAGLLSQLDTIHKPRPDEIIPANQRNPGPVWTIAERWTVRAIDEPDALAPTCVFISTPEHYGGDFDSMRTDNARRFAMAILAACDWADGLASGVTQLSSRVINGSEP